MTFKFIALALLASLSATAQPWFEAGVAQYTRWPDAVASWSVPGVGTWQGTADAVLADASGVSVLLFAANEQGRTFTLDEPKSVTVAPSVTVTAVLPVAHVLPEVDPAAKGALIPCRSEDGTATNYCALVADGTTNRWVRFATPAPLPETAVTVTIAYRTGPEIRYAVDGEPLTQNGQDWLPIVLPDGSAEIAAVGFRGGGELHALAGETEETPGTPVTLTIPALSQMTVTTVSVGGTPVAAEPDGTYRVPGGARVTVLFAAADGFLLTAESMSFRVGTNDLTLPESGRPGVRAAADVLRINEIMALPEEGEDWVELANSSDTPVDVTGWRLSDKPSAKGKWQTIEGEAVIPAHGWLVVRLGATMGARCDLGLDADGETMAFATPGGQVVDEEKFGFQFKGVSFGRDATGAWVHFPTPTPGAANPATGRTVPTPQVAFSVPHGYFTEAFTVALNCAARPDAAIYYTTDGTSPTAASARYTAPITVSQTTVLRAAVVEAASILQRDTSCTYLFVSDIVRQSGTPAGFPASGAVNGQTMVYGMRSSILSADGDRLMRGFTNGVRTVSLVIDPANLFNATTGIYVNARQEGIAWERPALVEQIHPLDPSDGFSAPCGLRIRGAASRSSSAPKHSFRLFFRGDYGLRQLVHPIFGADGAAVCDKIDLRADQNQSYANGDPCETMVHEVFSRDALRDLGQCSPNTRYFHLFLNGVYWGLYMYEERVSQCYAAAVNGGADDDYDVIRTQQPNYVTDLVEGTRTAMDALLKIINSEGFAAPFQNNYYRVQGRDALGRRDSSLPVYLNVTNLVDFMLQVHSVADADSPASAACFINQENNIMSFRCRQDGVGRVDGFVFLRHDAEWSMGFTEYFKSATKGAQLDTTDLGKDFQTFCPSRFHWRLCEADEYRMLVADRFYHHCLRDGGALTCARNEARFRARMAEIDEAIVGEVARWGHVPSTHANRETWLASCETYCLDFLRQRPAYHLQYYRNRGWYPSVEAPTLRDATGAVVQDGAQFAAGTALTLASPSEGTVYVTADGTDPRLAGGALNCAAQVVAAGVWQVPTGTVVVKARLRDASGEWSALEEVRVTGIDARTAALQAALRVREVMSSTREANGDGAEFIVLTNLNPAVALDLTGVRITCAKAGKAPSLDLTLAGSLAGARTLRKATDWPTQKITNGQVEMAVYAPDGTCLQTLGFDADWWNGACDGTGAFFVAQDWGTSVTGVDQWRGSYDAPTDATGAAAVEAVACGDDAGREWLLALGADAAGRAAIAGFARDASQLEACRLLGLLPENARLELWIPAIRFSAAGDEVLLDGALRVGGTNTACRLNGQLKVRLSASPTGPAEEIVEISARDLPLAAPIRLPVRRSSFLRLVVE